MELSARKIVPVNPSLHWGFPTMRHDSVAHSSGPSMVIVNFSVSVAFARTDHTAAGTATRHIAFCTPFSSYGTPMSNLILCSPGA